MGRDSWFAAELWTVSIDSKMGFGESVRLLRSVSIGCGVWTADELVVRAMSELWGRVDLGSVSVDCTVFGEGMVELGSVSVDCALFGEGMVDLGSVSVDCTVFGEGMVELGSVSVDCGVCTVFEEATAELGRSPLGSVSVDCGVDRGSDGRIGA